MRKDEIIWSERKRLWCGLPWTFTKFSMSENRLFVETGLLSLKEYEVRLYRVVNVALKRSLLQRLFGLGTVHIDSNDKDLGCFDIKNIRNAEEVKELISEGVERERERNRVSSREYMHTSYADDDDDDEEYHG